MRTDFKISFDGSDSTEVIRPVLEKIKVEDKSGRDADACYITLKATEMLIIPETGTDVVVRLGYSSPKILTRGTPILITKFIQKH